MKRMSGEARRAQIVEAAYAVILEKGLAEAATRDVTRRLGVGSGLLHHYFHTWKSLRAEVVQVFISKEIEELERTLTATPADKVFDVLVEWMMQDPAFQHWRLWLDAIEEARRDLDLADVVETGYLNWHRVLCELFQRVADSGYGTCSHPNDAAWRVSILVDGLVGMLVFDRTPLTIEAVGALLRSQLAMELNGAR